MKKHFAIALFSTMTFAAGVMLAQAAPVDLPAVPVAGAASGTNLAQLDVDASRPDMDHSGSVERPEVEVEDHGGVEHPEIDHASVEVERPEIDHPEIEKPEIEKPEIEKPDIQKPEIEKPELAHD